MMSNILVIIGGDAAGMTAASKVRREQPDRKIIVFEKSAHTSYSACGIPYFISQIVETYQELIVRTPEEFRTQYNIDVRTMHKALEVDTAKKRVRVLDKTAQLELWQDYDQLMIATGGKAFCPDVSEYPQVGVFGISTLKSGIKLEAYLEEYRPRTAVIIGGGYIGLEMAEALLIRGLSVSLINRSGQVMNTLDTDMGELVSEAMRKLGVTLYLNEEFVNFESENNKLKAVVTNKRTITTDIVVLGMGITPNTGFLKGSGISLAKKGAIMVDDRMQTNIADVYAAGDCIEVLNMVSGQHMHIALGTVANKTGLVAGTNLAGGNASFPGVVGTAVCKVCTYEVARTGLQEKDLDKLKIDYVSTKIESKTRAGYYPGSKGITVKLIAEKGTGRLLGGQIIGEEDAAKRVDVLAAALTHNLTLQNIIDLDLSYAPPFSLVWDPVQAAARKLIDQV